MADNREIPPDEIQEARRRLQATYDREQQRKPKKWYRRKRNLILVGTGVLFAALYLWLVLQPFPPPKEGALAAETELMKTAMNAMMADQNISTVTPNDNTTGSLGVNTWTGLPEGPGAAALDGILGKTTTRFYYCWDTKGNVYAQNKKDGVKAVPDDAEKQRPCREAPRDHG